MTTELSLDDYRGWLHKGLGRAVLATTPERARELRPILLDACLRNVAYLPWYAGSRAPWMLSILRRTDDLPFYAVAVEEALPRVERNVYGEQLSHLAALFALEGFSSLKPGVRRLLQQPLHPPPGTWVVSDFDGTLREECAHDACNEVRKLAGAPELQHSLGYFR